ncbi:Cytochrome c oxidase subunit 6A [Malassezia pachydermatis]|uniref:Mitochondrial cytochrome c oxidase subunit via n=1 Tax=Malassezia pachydermatis TaxID=77020 RepID=A0A0M8MLR1_9BASI|nr:mitochondrial cytochrome c oxidase subunit via [Malassezia pachydermatis]KOS12657.1 mitochondrial cytochrome c oxidase subunit via [Malassezia pachydermatis]
MSFVRAVVSRSAALRAAQPTLRRFNSFTPNPEAAKAFIDARQHAFEHAAQSTSLWRKISLYGMIPSAAVLAVYIYKIESEHAAHQAHVLEENGGELPERPDYEYLNIKNKKFPWGQQSLFYNPKVNYPSPEM